MSSIHLPPLDALSDILPYPMTRVSSHELSSHARLIALGDEVCEGRKTCHGCARLVQNVEGEVEGVFSTRNSSLPDFALCRRGDAPSERKLITIIYEASGKRIPPSPVDYGSLRCPRESGVHELV